MGKASLAMALADFIPTLCYLGGAWFIVRMMRKMGERELAGMFMFGAFLAGLSGFLKALSKVLDAIAARPVTESGFLYDHMFPMMAAAFLATATAIILGARRYSGRDPRGERTKTAETLAWISPFAVGLFLGLAFGLVLAKNAGAGFLAGHFAAVKLGSMVAMIVLQLATVGILAWFSFREGVPAAGVLAVVSVAGMLAMGMLASPSLQARFEDRILMNWLDQFVNLATQGSFLAAAFLVWRKAREGLIAGVARPHAGLPAAAGSGAEKGAST
ncbi:MAG: hypothetical protein JNG85_09680 [Spirochaetaceae bacterium]|nr:hypothetical protein [Spirochaetaceae bacterium]